MSQQKIWFRDTSFLGARVNFINRHDKFPEELVKACKNIEVVADITFSRDVAVANTIRICQKLRQKGFEKWAKWIEENCPGVITFNLASVNVSNDSINHHLFGSYSGQRA